MNSPDPVKPPDPTTPGSRPAPSALGQAAATAVTGVPVATLTVWLLETFGSAHGQPLKLDAVTATAIGAAGAAIAGYAYQLAMSLLQILAEKVHSP